MKVYFGKFEELNQEQKDECLLFFISLIDDFNKETKSCDLLNFSYWIVKKEILVIHIEFKDFQQLLFDVFNFYEISFYPLAKAIGDSR